MTVVYSTVRPHKSLGVLNLALVASVIHFISPESTLCLFIVSQVRAHLRSASDPHFFQMSQLFVVHDTTS
jgi:hypothetical protein